MSVVCFDQKYHGNLYGHSCRFVGRKWFNSFLQRHKSISLRTPEAVSAASAKVSESDIRGWFSQITSYLEEQGLLEVLQDASRIYNGDETSFFLHPKTKAVLAARGSRNVYEVEHASSHTNITVMFSFSADGCIVPPNIILPMQRIRADLLRTFPADWGIGKSDKGWMDASNFELYVRKVFYPFLLKKGVTFPVLYFVDGHSSHMAADVADSCLDLGIILIVLYPNTTRITQPADVAIFKPLKNAWKVAVSEWHGRNNGEILTLHHFGMVLQEAIKRGIVADSIVNGFKACGLHPFNPDSIDYSKCVANSAASAHDPDASQEPSPCIMDSVVIPCKTIELALKDIGEERLKKITNIGELSDDEVVIRNIYEKLIKPFHSSRTFTNSIDWEAKAPERFYQQADDYQSPLTEEQIQDMPVDFQTSDGRSFEVQQNDSFDVFGVPEPTSNDLWTTALELCTANSGSTGIIENVDIFTASNKTTVNSTDFIAGEMVAADSSFEQQQEISLQTFDELRHLDDTSHLSSGTSEQSSNIVDTHVAEQEEHVLMDITNEQVGMKRKMSISSFLNCPETPKRNREHRNYKRKFYPVLTAGERLEEIRQIEEDKMNVIQHRKEKAEKRAERKIETENQRAVTRELTKEKAEKRAEKKIEAEQLKVAMRERKHQELAIRKQERENLRKEKREKAAAK